MQDRTLETVVISISNGTAENAYGVFFLEKKLRILTGGKQTWCHVWTQDRSQNLSFVYERGVGGGVGGGWGLVK